MEPVDARPASAGQASMPFSSCYKILKSFVNHYYDACADFEKNL
jgi:hypothetical protein